MTLPAPDEFILIGHPVGHSMSPPIHGAAWRQLGRQGRYSLVDCADETQVAVQLERLRRGELLGANVTVPWKQLALRLADRVEEAALRIGAANVLSCPEPGVVLASNTDAPGLVDDLRAWNPEHSGAALVLGSGGASLAAVEACRRLGASQVYVMARRYQSGVERAAWPLAAQLSSLGAVLLPWWNEASEAREAALAEVSLIVQATSAGMKGSSGGEELAALTALDRNPQLRVYDLVYNPRRTPLLQKAEAMGLPVRDGLGMLVSQAARAIEIWWGELPDTEPMRKAAEAALGA